MKTTRFALVVAAALVLASTVQAQQKAVSGPAITGTMEITFKTRMPGHQDSSGAPSKDVFDEYKVDLVAGAIGIKGRIERTPRLVSSVLGRETQKGKIFYQLAWNFKAPTSATGSARW